MGNIKDIEGHCMHVHINEMYIFSIYRTEIDISVSCDWQQLLDGNFIYIKSWYNKSTLYIRRWLCRLHFSQSHSMNWFFFFSWYLNWKISIATCLFFLKTNRMMKWDWFDQASCFGYRWLWKTTECDAVIEP